MRNAHQESAHNAMKETKEQWAQLGITPTDILEVAEVNKKGYPHTKWDWFQWGLFRDAIRSVDPLHRGILKGINKKSSDVDVRELEWQAPEYTPKWSTCKRCGSPTCSGVGSTGVRCGGKG